MYEGVFFTIIRFMLPERSEIRVREESVIAQQHRGWSLAVFFESLRASVAAGEPLTPFVDDITRSEKELPISAQEARSVVDALEVHREHVGYVADMFFRYASSPGRFGATVYRMTGSGEAPQRTVSYVPSPWAVAIRTADTRDYVALYLSGTPRRAGEEEIHVANKSGGFYQHDREIPGVVSFPFIALESNVSPSRRGACVYCNYC